MRGQVDAPADVYLPEWVAGSTTEDWLQMLPILVTAGIEPPRIEDALHFVLSPITDSAAYLRAIGRVRINRQTGAPIR